MKQTWIVERLMLVGGSYDAQDNACEALFWEIAVKPETEASQTGNRPRNYVLDLRKLGGRYKI